MEALTVINSLWPTLLIKRTSNNYWIHGLIEYVAVSVIMNISTSSLYEGAKSPIQTADFLYRRTQIAVFNRLRATYIFEKEWDLLVVLDACRYDLMNELAVKKDLGFEVGSIFSPASITGFWMERNFSERFAAEKRDTAYVVAAPWSETKLSADNFATLDEVWSYAFDEELGTIHPEAVLDRAVEIG